LAFSSSIKASPPPPILAISSDPDVGSRSLRRLRTARVEDRLLILSANKYYAGIGNPLGIKGIEILEVHPNILRKPF
jgi:hypothetical protein